MVKNRQTDSTDPPVYLFNGLTDSKIWRFTAKRFAARTPSITDNQKIILIV